VAAEEKRYSEAPRLFRERNVFDVDRRIRFVQDGSFIAADLFRLRRRIPSPAPTSTMNVAVYPSRLTKPLIDRCRRGLYEFFRYWAVNALPSRTIGKITCCGGYAPRMRPISTGGTFFAEFLTDSGLAPSTDLSLSLTVGNIMPDSSQTRRRPATVRDTGKGSHETRHRRYVAD